MIHFRERKHILAGENEHDLQKCLGREYVDSQEGRFCGTRSSKRRDQGRKVHRQKML